MTATPRFNWSTWAEGQLQPNQTFNNQLVDQDQLIGLEVISKTTTAQPGSPTNGDAYIIPASATGAAWSTFSEDDVAFYWDDGSNASWVAVTPPSGLLAKVADEGGIQEYDGSVWAAPSKNFREESGTAWSFALGDEIARGTNAAAIAATIPANSAVPFPIGTELLVLQGGAGAITVSITTDTLAGVTATTGINTWLRLVKVAATTWIGLA